MVPPSILIIVSIHILLCEDMNKDWTFYSYGYGEGDFIDQRLNVEFIWLENQIYSQTVERVRIIRFTSWTSQNLNHAVHRAKTDPW